MVMMEVMFYFCDFIFRDGYEFFYCVENCLGMVFVIYLSCVVYLFCRGSVSICLCFIL